MPQEVLIFSELQIQWGWILVSTLDMLIGKGNKESIRTA
jgi:hypothetical protein